MTSSLKGRLLLGLLGCVLLGLLVSDVVTYTSLQSFLIGKVDQQLAAGETQVLGYFTGHPQGGGDDFSQPSPAPQPSPFADGQHAPPEGFPVNTWLELCSPQDRQCQVHRTVPIGNSTPSAQPRLPSHLNPAGSDVPHITTVRGSGSVDYYRVLVERTDAGFARNDVVVLAIPLSDVESTLHQLLLEEVLVTGAVLVGLALLAWLIVRVGLRPLDRVEATAAAIAAGDLSQRVTITNPSTEVGRLSVALNAMLSQIERAFDERSQSEQRLRRFVADASHELRTPLTSIRGYAELLRRRPAPSGEDVAVARRRIEEEAIRMSGLVDDMLLLARLDQGRPLAQEPVKLDRIARDAVEDARVASPERAISFTGPTQVIVAGDEPRLRQVVANLVRNAVVHTPRGTPIEVEVGSAGGEGRLSVIDHGQGLPAGSPERLFEPFFRADPSRSRDRGGSGLGLSIVAAVVAAHGGRVRVVSTPGGGATFSVELPLSQTAGKAFADLPGPADNAALDRSA